MSDPRRSLPSVDAALSDPAIAGLVGRHPRAQVVDAVREALAERRARRAGGEGLADQVSASLRPSLRPVLNATGVVLHTNLGRAPLAGAAVEAAVRARRLHDPGMAARERRAGLPPRPRRRPTCGR